MDLVERFEEFICDEFVGKTLILKITKSICKAFSKLEKAFAFSNQKTFVQRIDSAFR
jgi:hypothetical protein